MDAGLNQSPLSQTDEKLCLHQTDNGHNQGWMKRDQNRTTRHSFCNAEFYSEAISGVMVTEKCLLYNNVFVGLFNWGWAL